jgi:membrane-associated phospholipid phosphatase
LTLEWIVVYGGANWIAGMHRYRISLETVVDQHIPFVALASFVYLSLFPLLWLAPFRLRSPEQLRRLAVGLGWLIFLSGVGFLILPCQAASALPKVNGWGSEAFRLADQINLTHNYLPSLHVGMAVVCAHAYGHRAAQTTAAAFWLWATAIALSTLVTHQHFLVDVATGGILGAVVAHKCRV